MELVNVDAFGERHMLYASTIFIHDAQPLQIGLYTM
jgi:hypothetical protein